MKKRNWEYTSLIIITIMVAIFRIGMLIKFPCYDYDETIITSISRQPLEMLIDTVKAEPHPPTFYIFLKVFNTENIIVTKIFTTIIALSLTIISFYVGEKKNLWEKHKLYPALLLITLSTGYLYSISRVKQDFITIPLTILFFTIYLLYRREKEIKYLNWMFLISMIIGSLGIRPLANLVPIWLFELIKEILLSIKSKKITSNTKNILIRGLLIGLVFNSYMGIYGTEQLAINKYRLAWTYEGTNSLGVAIVYSFLPYNSIKPYAEFILVLTFLALFIKYIQANKTQDSDKLNLTKDLYQILLLNILFGYATQSFTQIRYAFLSIFLLYMILASFRIRKEDIKFIIMMLPSLLALNLITYGKEINSTYYTLKNYREEVEKIYMKNPGDDILWISSVGSFPTVFMEQYFYNKNHEGNDYNNFYTLSNQYDIKENNINKKALELDKTINNNYWEKKGKHEMIESINKFMEINPGEKRILYSRGIINPGDAVYGDTTQYLRKICKKEEIFNNEEYMMVSYYYEDCSIEEK